MSDLISRQAAIDDLHGRDPSQIWDTADIEVWINALPSAQPEQQWIPCSERLPEEGVNVLLCIKDWESQIHGLLIIFPPSMKWLIISKKT